MRDLTVIKGEIEQGSARARSLKTKKAQVKAWDLVRELRSEALNVLFAQRDAYATHTVQATVRWFHSGDDTVALSTPYGTLHGNPTSDAVSKSWYGHTCCVEYTEGQQVTVEIDVDVCSDRLCLEVIPKRIFGGTLNAEQYAKLCENKNLAFFKYPNTDGVTGLFAQSESA